MSLDRKRLLIRDCAAGAAFLAMLVSWQVPVWASALFGGSWLLAVLDRRPLSHRSGLTAAILISAATLLGGSIVWRFLDPVVAACAFAALLTATRLLAEPTRSTDHQLLLVALLMVAGGAALSAELTFALGLLAYLVLAGITLAMGAVADHLPPRETAPTGTLMRPLALGVGLLLVGTVVTFTVLPRLSWNAGMSRNSAGVGPSVSGFSDGVRLFGGGGSIKRDPRVVARITLAPSPADDRLDSYWLGRTYDVFTGTEWTNSDTAWRSGTQAQIAPGSETLVRQEIDLLPTYGSSTLIALAPPVVIGNVKVKRSMGDSGTYVAYAQGREVRAVRSGHGYSYEAYSLPSAEAGARDRRRRRVADRDADDRYLTLPDGLDPRIAALARELTDGMANPAEQARRLERHLAGTFQYSLEQSGDAADPLAHFLFDRREGHCELFASALTVLLRSAGIPARLATGFYGGERSGEGYVLRAADAHAWTQAWLPGQGWVDLDATPPSGRRGQPNAFLDALVGAAERLDAWWRASVVDYSLLDQLRGLDRLFGDEPEAAPKPEEGTTSGPPPLAVLVALCLAWGTYRLALWSGSRPPKSVLESRRLLSQTERLLGRVGVELRPGEQLEELAARLQARGHPLARIVGSITRRYLEARFGGRPLEPGERQRWLRLLREAIDDSVSSSRRAA